MANAGRIYPVRLHAQRCVRCGAVVQGSIAGKCPTFPWDTGGRSAHSFVPVVLTVADDGNHERWQRLHAEWKAK